MYWASTMYGDMGFGSMYGSMGSDSMERSMWSSNMRERMGSDRMGKSVVLGSMDRYTWVNGFDWWAVMRRQVSMVRLIMSIIFIQPKAV